MKTRDQIMVYLILLLSMTFNACKKDNDPQMPAPLELLSNSKTWTLANPSKVKCKSFGVSNGIRFPYDRMLLSSASFTVSKTNDQFIITESKSGTEQGIADFSPLIFTNVQTNYQHSYHISYNPVNKTLSYQQIPDQAYPSSSLFFLIGGYRVVSASKDSLVVRDPFPLDNGLNGKWIGDLTFVSH